MTTAMTKPPAQLCLAVLLLLLGAGLPHTTHGQKPSSLLVDSAASQQLALAADPALTQAALAAITSPAAAASVGSPVATSAAAMPATTTGVTVLTNPAATMAAEDDTTAAAATAAAASAANTLTCFSSAAATAAVDVAAQEAGGFGGNTVFPDAADNGPATAVFPLQQAGGEAVVCIRYQFQCSTIGQSTCTPDEISRNAWRWMYGATDNSTCADLKKSDLEQQYYRSIFCCSTSRCNKPLDNPSLSIIDPILGPSSVTATAGMLPGNTLGSVSDSLSPVAAPLLTATPVISRNRSRVVSSAATPGAGLMATVLLSGATAALLAQL